VKPVENHPEVDESVRTRAPPMAVAGLVKVHGELAYQVMLADGTVVQMQKQELIETAPNAYLDYLEHRLIQAS
jgi:hypothetical protein